MALSTYWGWSNVANIIMSIILAFFFGYLLTIQSLYRKGSKQKEAIKSAVATDTTSIISMEAVDNLFILLVPGAINASLNSWLFWVSLLTSLAVAFLVTVPVNRFFISRNRSLHNHH